MGDLRTEEDGEEELVNEAGEIVRDVTCVGCEYNLRGLHARGKCPECGMGMRKSVRAAMERVLCLKCMFPNHPAAAVCEKCGAGIMGAAATAGYWQATPRPVPEQTREGRASWGLGAAICVGVIIVVLMAICAVVKILIL
jgi:hypothetical protein